MLLREARWFKADVSALRNGLIVKGQAVLNSLTLDDGTYVWSRNDGFNHLAPRNYPEDGKINGEESFP